MGIIYIFDVTIKWKIYIKYKIWFIFITFNFKISVYFLLGTGVNEVTFTYADEFFSGGDAPYLHTTTEIYFLPIDINDKYWEESWDSGRGRNSQLPGGGGGAPFRYELSHFGKGFIASQGSTRTGLLEALGAVREAMCQTRGSLCPQWGWLTISGGGPLACGRLHGWWPRSILARTMVHELASVGMSQNCGNHINTAISLLLGQIATH